MDEKSEAVVHFYDQAHDGPGWYYYIADYPDEGCVGSFETLEKAIEHAEKSDFCVAPYPEEKP